MKICKQCRDEIPTWITIDGKRRNTQRRIFCLKCSPFGSHNTSSRNPPKVLDRKCSCGETDSTKFYGRKAGICGKCHLAYTTERGRQAKKKAREYLGGKCVHCGYDTFDVALDIHHVDPSKKDPNFSSMRSWTWERILRELAHCVLLCKNCHTAFHAGMISM